jgi:23S rRNA (cytidine1920-2'-O)/16S rRNA (cytidine1409-2'-O)-methyltransferase
VGRGAGKLRHAARELHLDFTGLVAADFGCNIGGFTDYMLHEGAVRVYAVDTGYGMLEWKLRQDDRVVVMERTNAMHAELPEKVDVLTIDTAWTCQRNILPNALRQVKEDGLILSLFKPQYEADRDLVHRGKVDVEDWPSVLEATLQDMEARGIPVERVIELPHKRKSKNKEAILVIKPARARREDVPEPGEEPF